MRLVVIHETRLMLHHAPRIRVRSDDIDLAHFLLLLLLHHLLHVHSLCHSLMGKPRLEWHSVLKILRVNMMRLLRLHLRVVHVHVLLMRHIMVMLWRLIWLVVKPRLHRYYNRWIVLCIWTNTARHALVYVR